MLQCEWAEDTPGFSNASLARNYCCNMVQGEAMQLMQLSNAARKAGVEGGWQQRGVRHYQTMPKQSRWMRGADSHQRWAWGWGAGGCRRVRGDCTFMGGTNGGWGVGSCFFRSSRQHHAAPCLVSYIELTTLHCEGTGLNERT